MLIVTQGWANEKNAILPFCEALTKSRPSLVDEAVIYAYSE
jgi:hypothetical protein